MKRWNYDILYISATTETTLSTDDSPVSSFVKTPKISIFPMFGGPSGSAEPTRTQTMSSKTAAPPMTANERPATPPSTVADVEDVQLKSAKTTCNPKIVNEGNLCVLELIIAYFLASLN